MEIRDYAVGMATYNQWMNEKVYACAADLSDEERKRDLGAAFHSIHGTLNHILLADEAWMQRFLREPVTMTSPDQELHADFAHLWEARRAMDAEIGTWAGALAPEFSETPFAFHSVTYGRDRIIPGWAAVAHFFNHQTHHRGQITTLLAQFGKDPGVTDFPWMPYFDEE